MIKLILTFPHVVLGTDGKDRYKVVQVEQTTGFIPGQFLTREEVQDMCDMHDIYRIIIKGAPK